MRLALKAAIMVGTASDKKPSVRKKRTPASVSIKEEQITMIDWRKERGEWEVHTIVALRRSGRAWQMELPEMTLAREVLDDRSLARARLEGNTTRIEDDENNTSKKRTKKDLTSSSCSGVKIMKNVVIIDDVDDGQLLALSGAVLARNGVIKQRADTNKPALYNTRGFLAKLGEGPLDHILVYLGKNELGHLFQTDRATKDAAFGAISWLRLESSALAIIKEKLLAPWRLRELDVTAYAIFTNKNGEILSFAKNCPNLTCLTLRQVYVSPRLKDKTTVFELNGVSMPRRSWHYHMTTQDRNNDPRIDFARHALGFLLYALRNSITQLRLYLDGDEWLRPKISETSSSDDEEEIQNKDALIPRAPHGLKKLTLGSVVRKAAHARGRAPAVYASTDLRIEDVWLFLSEVKALESISIEADVSLDARFFEQCAQRFQMLESFQAPRMGASAEHKWSCVMANSRARSWMVAPEPIRTVDSVRAMASQAVNESVTLRSFYTKAKSLKRMTSTLRYVTKLKRTSPVSYYGSQPVSEEERHLIRSARTEIRRALDESLSALSASSGLEHLDLLFDERGSNFWGDQSEDVGWPNLAAELAPAIGWSLKSIRLDGGKNQNSYYARPRGPQKLGDWLAMPTSLIFESRFKRLCRVQLENVAFQNNDLYIRSPPTLVSVTFRAVYRLKSLHFQSLPQLRHVSIDDPCTNTNYIFSSTSSHYLRSLSIHSCPKLTSLIVDADLFSSSNNGYTAGILLRGAFPALSTICLYSTKKSSARSVDSPTAILSDVIKRVCERTQQIHALDNLILPRSFAGDDEEMAFVPSLEQAVENGLPFNTNRTTECMVEQQQSPPFNLNLVLDKYLPGWRERLNAAAAHPEQLEAWRDQLVLEPLILPGDNENCQRARDALLSILREQRQQLLDSGCCLSLDSQLCGLVTARFENVQVPIVGTGEIVLDVDKILELILDQLDQATATCLYRALTIKPPSKLRRLDLSNFSIESTPALILPASLRELSLHPVQGTRSLRLDASACGSRLQRLSLGGPSLANIIFTSDAMKDEDEMKTTVLPNCRELILRAERMKAEALHSLLAVLPQLTTLRLVKCRALDPGLTLTVASANTISLDGCTHVTSLRIQGERLTDLELLRLGKISSLALFAPFLSSLNIAYCKVLDDTLLDRHTSSTFDCLAQVHVLNCKRVTINFFAPFAASRNRSSLKLTMRNCDATYKPKGAITKGVIDVTKTDAWLNMDGRWVATPSEHDNIPQSSS